MKRVFLIAPIPRFDTQSASAFGKVEYLFDDIYAVNALSGQAAMDQIIAALDAKSFDPTSDMIALTGPQALLVMLSLAASERARDGAIQALIFDARSGGTYRHRVLTPYLPDEQRTA